MTDRRRFIFAVAGFALLVLVAATVAVWGSGGDALAYRLAAERLLGTGSPYQDFQLAGPYDPARPGGLSYLYLPPFALLLTPLLLFPPKAAVLFFALVSMSASVAAFFVVLRHAGIRFALCFPLAVFITALCYPSLDDAINGNVSALLGLAVALILTGSARRAGITLAAATVLKMTPAALFPFIALRGRAALRPFVLTLVCLLAPSLLFPDAYRDFPTVLMNLIAFGPSQQHPSISPAESGALLFGPAAYAPLRLIVSVVALGGLGLALLAALRRRPLLAVTAGLYGSLLLPTTLWNHYLIAPAVLTLALGLWSGGRRGALLLFVGGVALSLAGLLSLPALFLLTLPLLLGLSLAAALRLDRGGVVGIATR